MYNLSDPYLTDNYKQIYFGKHFFYNYKNLIPDKRSLRFFI